MKKKSLNYNLGIKKVLALVHPTLQIKKVSIELINNMILDLAKKLIKTSELMSRLSKRVTINNKELTSALILIMPNDLVNNAVEEGRKAVYRTKINSVNKSKKSKENKAELQLKVSVTRNIVENQIGKNSRISKEYSIYLTAVLEYLVAEIIDLTGIYIQEHEEHKKITPKDIMMAIRNDSELNALFHGFILGTGVVPNIHSESMNGGKVVNPNTLKEYKDNLKKISKTGLRRLMYRAGIKYVSGLIYEESRFIIQNLLKQILKYTAVIVEQKNHTTVMYEDGIEALKHLNIEVYSTRGFPGKIAPCKGKKLTVNDTSSSVKRRKPKVHLMKNIQKYQKTDCTLLQHKPIDLLIREISQKYEYETFRFESDFIWLIHATIESYMVKFYQDVSLLALHAGRTTVHPRDLELLKKIRSMK